MTTSPRDGDLVFIVDGPHHHLSTTHSVAKPETMPTLDDLRATLDRLGVPSTPADRFRSRLLAEPPEAPAFEWKTEHWFGVDHPSSAAALRVFHAPLEERPPPGADTIDRGMSEATDRDHEGGGIPHDVSDRVWRREHRASAGRIAARRRAGR